MVFSAACGEDFSDPFDSQNSDSGSAVPGPECAGPAETEVIRLGNDARADDGGGPLRCSADLAAVARAHSQDMCDRGFFAHDNLDGESPFDRMRAAGIRYSAAGENIAQGQSTAGQVHTAWMGSSGHRRNILNEGFGRIGVGYVPCEGARRHYWTQVFAN